MSELGDVAKGGGFVGAVCALLLTLRHYIPRRNGNASKIAKMVEEQVRREVANEKTIRDLIAEQRDDQMLQCLNRMEEFQKQIARDHTQLLHNMRDILRDVAVSRGLPVRYYDKD